MLIFAVLCNLVKAYWFVFLLRLLWNFASQLILHITLKKIILMFCYFVFRLDRLLEDFSLFIQNVLIQVTYLVDLFELML